MLYKKKYYKYKNKYKLLKLIVGGENKIFTPSDIYLNFVFPKKEGIERNNLLLTSVGKYSASGWRAGYFIANIIKKYYKSDMISITDGTGNIGSDTIIFSFKFNKVNSIEIDKNNFKALENNIKTYNLKNTKLYFGDTTKLLDKLEQDIIYIDAPWGGPDYKKNDYYKLYLGELELTDIYRKFKNKAKMFVFKVPLNYDINNFINKIKEIYKELHIHTYIKKSNNEPIFNILIIR